MPTELKLWRIEWEHPRVIPQAKLDLESRLEEWLREDIGLVSNDLLVIGQQVWDRICSLQEQRFVTKTGKPFTYLLESGTTVWVERDGKRINQNLVKSNFSQVYSMMQSKPIAGPAEINERAIENGESQVRGQSYVWAILYDKRVIP